MSCVLLEATAELPLVVPELVALVEVEPVAAKPLVDPVALRELVLLVEPVAVAAMSELLVDAVAPVLVDPDDAKPLVEPVALSELVLLAAPVLVEPVAARSELLVEEVAPVLVEPEDAKPLVLPVGETAPELVEVLLPDRLWSLLAIVELLPVEEGDIEAEPDAFTFVFWFVLLAYVELLAEGELVAPNVEPVLELVPYELVTALVPYELVPELAPYEVVPEPEPDALPDTL